MTRIIAGSARGRRLRTPTGEATRPTSDRVREALFSALQSRLGSLHGVRLLDLYAGSGAVALEALSRGAEAVTAVESDRRTAAIVTENARTLGVGDQVEVIAQRVERVLDRPAPRAFDVVFADPPYPLGQPEVEQMLGLIVTNGWIVESGVLVLERSARSVEPTWPEPLVLDSRKAYGESVLWYVRAGSSGSAQNS